MTKPLYKLIASLCGATRPALIGVLSLLATTQCGVTEQSPSMTQSSNIHSNLLTASNVTVLSSSKNDAIEWRFGSSLSLAEDGASAVVGTFLDKGSSLGIYKIYQTTGSSWMSNQKNNVPAAQIITEDEIRISDGAISANGLAIISSDIISGRLGISEKVGSDWQHRDFLFHRGWCYMGAEIGYAVAISADGSVIAISCPDLDGTFYASNGSVVLLKRKISATGTISWNKIMHFDETPGEQFFGSDISMSANARTLLVNARKQDTMTGNWTWKVYVFDLDADFSLRKTTELEPDDIELDDGFGKSLSISSDGLTAVVGAPYKGSYTGGPKFGAAYIFSRPDENIIFSQKRLSIDSSSSDLFGEAVAISGDGQRALIGAPMEANGLASKVGASYLYERNGDNWNLQGKIRGAGTRSGSLFGQALALDKKGETALIGAPRVPPPIGAVGSPLLPASGQVFIYTVKRQNGDRCSTASECKSDFCVDGVCCDNTCGGGALSDCQACSKALGALVDGTCGTVTAKASITCRPARSSCDLAETCDGLAPTCPADQVVTAPMVLCRAAAGACDKPEYCDGRSPICPMDTKKVKSDDPCRPAKEICDEPEFCNGFDVTCPPDEFSKNDKLCRDKLNSCDRKEYCTGRERNCPDDLQADNGSVCVPDGSVSQCVVSGHGQCQDGKCQAINEKYGKPCGDDKMICDGLGQCRL